MIRRGNRFQSDQKERIRNLASRSSNGHAGSNGSVVPETLNFMEEEVIPVIKSKPSALNGWDKDAKVTPLEEKDDRSIELSPVKKSKRRESQKSGRNSLDQVFVDEGDGLTPPPSIPRTSSGRQSLGSAGSNSSKSSMISPQGRNMIGHIGDIKQNLIDLLEDFVLSEESPIPEIRQYFEISGHSAGGRKYKLKKGTKIDADMLEQWKLYIAAAEELKQRTAREQHHSFEIPEIEKLSPIKKRSFYHEEVEQSFSGNLEDVLNAQLSQENASLRKLLAERPYTEADVQDSEKRNRLLYEYNRDVIESAKQLFNLKQINFTDFARKLATIYNPIIGQEQFEIPEAIDANLLVAFNALYKAKYPDTSETFAFANIDSVLFDIFCDHKARGRKFFGVRFDASSSDQEQYQAFIEQMVVKQSEMLLFGLKDRRLALPQDLAYENIDDFVQSEEIQAFTTQMTKMSLLAKILIKSAQDTISHAKAKEHILYGMHQFALTGINIDRRFTALWNVVFENHQMDRAAFKDEFYIHLIKNLDLSNPLHKLGVAKFFNTKSRSSDGEDKQYFLSYSRIIYKLAKTKKLNLRLLAQSGDVVIEQDAAGQNLKIDKSYSESERDLLRDLHAERSKLISSSSVLEGFVRADYDYFRINSALTRIQDKGVDLKVLSRMIKEYSFALKRMVVDDLVDEAKDEPKQSDHDLSPVNITKLFATKLLLNLETFARKLEDQIVIESGSDTASICSEQRPNNNRIEDLIGLRNKSRVGDDTQEQYRKCYSKSKQLAISDDNVDNKTRFSDQVVRVLGSMER